MIIGYARVSTDGQTLDAQQARLKAAGAEEVFAEKISGAVTDRRQLARAIAVLGPGDVLLVTRLDRRARSTRGLLNTLDAVAKAGEVQVACRCLGGHYHTARRANDHDPGGAGDLRAAFDPGQNR
jgi:DNA invertase Pin-like site-specific DNA recombinase